MGRPSGSPVTINMFYFGGIQLTQTPKFLCQQALDSPKLKAKGDFAWEGGASNLSNPPSPNSVKLLFSTSRSIPNHLLLQNLLKLIQKEQVIDTLSATPEFILRHEASVKVLNPSL